MRTLVGKVEYTSSTSVQGRFGRAALAVLRAFEERSRGRTGASDQLPLGGEVLLALTFLLRVLPLLRPKSIRLWGKGSRMPPVIIYTDARYERSNDNPAEVGIVIFDRSLPFEILVGYHFVYVRPQLGYVLVPFSKLCKNECGKNVVLFKNKRR